jgi:subtilisin family serine protease
VPGAVLAYQNASNVVRYAEPDGVLHLASTIPNDPRFGDLWGLHNTGQTGGTPGVDIHAPEAWDMSRGTGVVVAVFDTGIDYNHEDLHANIWSNAGEIADNQIDDDGNGYVDDVYGIDLYNHDSDPMDDENHGTHCAGIIGAVGSNGIGVVGVAWQAKVMAVKIFNSAGSARDAFVSDMAQGLHYVIQMAQRGINVRVTSNSYGVTRYSQTVRDAIRAAASYNILVVAAVDNQGLDLDDAFWDEDVYPACYDEPNVISVAAMDHNGQMPAWSNRGVRRVDLSAPGDNIWSTIRGNGYASMSGTSMATPHVAGVAALLFSYDSTVTMDRVRELLLDGVDHLAGPIGGRTATDGCVNAAKSLAMLKAVPAPSCQPPAGFYDANVIQVTIQCQMSGAAIYYTTNGVDPDETSPAYTVPVSIPLGTTLKARAYTQGRPESPVKSGTYLWPRVRAKRWAMNTDPEWTTEGLWQFGIPLGTGWGPDPTAGATGSNVYGYNLAGDYEKGITRALTTSGIDCSNLRQTQLRFQRWLCLNIGQVSVAISTNGTTWTDIWVLTDPHLPDLPGAIWERSWGLHTYDISSIADGQPTVFIRWVMGPTHPFYGAQAGWNIDDVEIWGSIAPHDVNYSEPVWAF